MLIGRSLYRPLVHFYKLVSWGVCQNVATACHYDRNSEEIGQAAVATSHYEATRIGTDVLEAGGNAVDAAIAIGYALAVVHPCCGNLGGGGFMTLRLSDGTNRFINFREIAPLAATPTLYQNSEGEVIKGLSTDGYLAVAVPGTVAGLEYARKAYGSGQLTRQELVAPAQKLAKEGFVLTDSEQDLLKRELKNNQNTEVADIFTLEGKPIAVGDRLVQPELAETLSLLAEKGASAFYEGEIAQKIVRASQQHNGILTLEDFKVYQVQDIDPLTCNYQGFTILTSPPPGGGPVLCQMLNIVEGFPISQTEYRSVQHLHWMLSAMLFSYRDRNLYFGDPTFVEIPTERILSKAYAEELRFRIPKDRAPELTEALPSKQGQDTTHFSVVDKQGNAVAVTYTINKLFWRRCDCTRYRIFSKQ